MAALGFDARHVTGAIGVAATLCVVVASPVLLAATDDGAATNQQQYEHCVSIGYEPAGCASYYLSSSSNASATDSVAQATRSPPANDGAATNQQQYEHCVSIGYEPAGCASYYLSSSSSASATPAVRSSVETNSSVLPNSADVSGTGSSMRATSATSVGANATLSAGACPTDFAAVLQRMPRYSDPQLALVRQVAASADPRDMLEQAAAMGYSPSEAVRLQYEQAKEDRVVLEDAKECIRAMSSNPASSLAEAQRATSDQSYRFYDSVTGECIKSYVYGYWLAELDLYTAKVMDCLIGRR